MEKKIMILCISVIFTLSIAGCKKSSNNTTNTSTFKADTVFTLIEANAFPNYNDWNSIAMDVTGNKIFFYYSNVTDGFRIDMLDLATGSTSIIY